MRGGERGGGDEGREVMGGEMKGGRKDTYGGRKTNGGDVMGGRRGGGGHIRGGERGGRKDKDGRREGRRQERRWSEGEGRGGEGLPFLPPSLSSPPLPSLAPPKRRREKKIRWREDATSGKMDDMMKGENDHHETDGERS